ncbi:hypothetical protein BKA66DRAFT_452717 [Pyrenochaeta sp. MPI-SDFR-AT-0127]|nr:hypothetical protein BKA66DRAFT_452717 [Pyrenochaeta sp. MPI-SDFR-AT-0127]
MTAERQLGRFLVEIVVDFLFLVIEHITYVYNEEGKDLLGYFKYACEIFEPNREAETEKMHIKMEQDNIREEEQAMEQRYRKPYWADTVGSPKIKREYNENEEENSDIGYDESEEWDSDIKYDSTSNFGAQVFSNPLRQHSKPRLGKHVQSYSAAHCADRRHRALQKELNDPMAMTRWQGYTSKNLDRKSTSRMNEGKKLDSPALNTGYGVDCFWMEGM